MAETNLITHDPAGLIAAEDLGAALDLYDQAAARFLATRKSEATRRGYGYALDIYRTLAEEMGADPLRADVLIMFNMRMQARRRDKGGDLANDTIRARMAAVQSFFSWCWGYDLTPLKPEQVGDILDPPPARKLSPRDVLEEDEAQRLVEAAGDPEARALVRVLLDGGLRIGEGLGLRCGDIYTAGGSYFLNVIHTKGGEPREVKIPPDLYRELAEYAGGQGLDIRDRKLAEEPIFTISPVTAWRRVKAAAASAGIDKAISPHNLRHTHANDLAMEGWPVELIAERLGHRSMDTTRLYTRPAKLLRQRELPVMPWHRER